jgi:hypothetical protein
MFEHIPEVAGLTDQREKVTCSTVKVCFGLHFRTLQPISDGLAAKFLVTGFHRQLFSGSRLMMLSMNF